MTDRVGGNPTNKNPYLAVKLGIACAALLTAVSVYVFTRPNPPDLLAGLHWRSDWLAGYSAYFDSAPSLFYTLAVGLFIGIFAPTRGAALRHCAAWTGIAACLELTQAAVVAARLIYWLEAVLPAPVWGLIGPYWLRGVFDPLDLLATFAGGAIAFLLLSRSLAEKAHATRD